MRCFIDTEDTGGYKRPPTKGPWGATNWSSNIGLEEQPVICSVSLHHCSTCTCQVMQSKQRYERPVASLASPDICTQEEAQHKQRMSGKLQLPDIAHSWRQINDVTSLATDHADKQNSLQITTTMGMMQHGDIFIKVYFNLCNSYLILNSKSMGFMSKSH